MIQLATSLSTEKNTESSVETADLHKLSSSDRWLFRVAEIRREPKRLGLFKYPSLPLSIRIVANDSSRLYETHREPSLYVTGRVHGSCQQPFAWDSRGAGNDKNAYGLIPISPPSSSLEGMSERSEDKEARMCWTMRLTGSRPCPTHRRRWLTGWLTRYKEQHSSRQRERHGCVGETNTAARRCIVDQLAGVTSNRLSTAFSLPL